MLAIIRPGADLYPEIFLRSCCHTVARAQLASFSMCFLMSPGHDFIAFSNSARSLAKSALAASSKSGALPAIADINLYVASWDCLIVARSVLAERA